MTAFSKIATVATAAAVGLGLHGCGSTDCADVTAAQMLATRRLEDAATDDAATDDTAATGDVAKCSTCIEGKWTATQPTTEEMVEWGTAAAAAVADGSADSVEAWTQTKMTEYMTEQMESMKTAATDCGMDSTEADVAAAAALAAALGDLAAGN